MFNAGAGLVSTKTLLESGRFVVPDFQRNYAWDSRQINEFWSDLEFATKSNEQHFVGSVILLSEDGQQDLQVIDGQQRLTTIFMLISLIRDVIKEQETQEIQLAANAFDLSVEPINMIFKDLANATPRFQANAQIQRDFLDCILRNANDPKCKKFKKRDRAETRKLRKSYVALEKSLRDYVARNGGEDVQSRLRALHAIYRSLMENFKFMSIFSSNRKEAITIYMTLNNRGLGLSPSDLVKSLLIRFVSKTADGKGFLEGKEVLARWGEIVENVGEDSLDQFLRHYQLVYGKRDSSGQAVLDIREKDIFSVFERDVLGTPKDPQPDPAARAYAILEDLQKKSWTYERFLKFDYPKNDEKDDEIQQTFDLTFRGLYSLADSYRVIFLALFDEDLALPMEELKEWVHLVESVVLRWLIVGGNAQQLENAFQAGAQDVIALQMDSEQAAVNLRKRMYDFMQSDEQLTTRLCEALDDASLFRFIAFKLNETLGGKQGALKFDPKVIHVEHIAPDSSTEDWRNVLGLNSGDADEIAAEYDDLTERFGNKTLLEWKINSGLQNKSFDQKKTGLPSGKKKKINGYKDSQISLTQDLMSLDEWNRELIELRSRWFADMFNAIWGITSSTRVEKFSQWREKNG